jgi:protoporphyrinogen oxidase
MNNIVLGGGISGLSAAYHLSEAGFPVILYEKEREIGGLCRSINQNGFIFDHGIHVSFTSNEYVRGIFSSSVCNDYYNLHSYSLNLWNGYWIRHEPHRNLNSLPKEIIKNCLIDFIYSLYEKDIEINNYRDWCNKNLGSYFTENFTAKYTRKFWTLEPEELTADWISERISKPSLESIVDGALGIPNAKSYYINSFLYPKEGGFVSFLNNLNNTDYINLNTYPIEIDPIEKKISLNNGEVRNFDNLISSIPLPELIKCIKNPPNDILEAVDHLKWTSLLMLNFSTDLDRKVGGPLWNYYYDEDIPYTRLDYPARLSENNSRKGYESIQIEIPYSREKPLPLEKCDLINKTKECISETENLPIDKINYLGDMNINYGYVIYDLNRKGSLEIIRRYLKDIGICSCGRFGRWEYLWSDQAFISGMMAAKHIISRMSPNYYIEPSSKPQGMLFSNNGD